MTARHLVRFGTGWGQFAVDVGHVLEVATASRLTELPDARAGVAGLLDREGDAIAVLNTLGGGPDPSHILVLTGDDDQPFGLLVDEVHAVEQVDAAEVGDPPPGQRRDLVEGVFRRDHRLVMIVSAERLAGRYR